MTTLTKIGSLVLVGGGVVGAGTAYALSSSAPIPSIRETITKANRTVLGASDSGWDIKLHTYNALTSKIELTNKTENALKTWCAEVLDKPSNKENEKIQRQAIKVCTLPTSREKLLKESKAIATGDDWQARETAYLGEGKAALAIPEFRDKAKPTKKDIEDWCSTALDVEIKDGKGNYDLTLKWCTKAGT